MNLVWYFFFFFFDRFITRFLSLSRCNWGLHFLFIYFKATLMVFPLLTLPCKGCARGKGCRFWVSVECIWHITFGSLLSNFCVCFGRAFWLCYLWPCQAVAQLVKRAVIPLVWPPLKPTPLLCASAFLWSSEFRGKLLHLTCGWAMRAKKYSL